MQKNLYSLILSENVVAAVDRLAHSMNTNRSNMVNQILAEYVSYVTPEKRMRQIFQRLEAILSQGGDFQILAQPSDSVFQLRSALAFKYNPTVRYSVELFRRTATGAGELRVSLRTQNSTLGLYILQFFKLWTKIEHSYRPETESALEDGKFVKKLNVHLPQENAEGGPELLASAISAYINAFDSAMKAFFYQINNPNAAAEEVERIYKNYIGSCEYPI